MEDEEGAFKAVEHLIEQGCRRIVHLAGPENLGIGFKRLEGYTRVLRAHEIEVDPTLVVDSSFGAHLDEGDHIETELLDQGLQFDGIFANNDLTAVGAIRALKRRWIKIPDEVAVIGYSNWQLAALVDPALSSVHQPGFEMGQIAAQMFFDQIKHPDQPIRHEVLKTHVVARASSIRS